MKRTGLLLVALLVLAVGTGLGLGAWKRWKPVPQVSAEGRVDGAVKRQVLFGYRQLAERSYEAAYHSTGRLNEAIRALLAAPSESSLRQARQAWREAHRDYARTEVFRFGNWIVDDWEAGINAWPVDEGILDYVDDTYAATSTNPLARQNLVANPHLKIDGIDLDLDTMNVPQLSFIHGGSDIEANVVLGFHAIEFLLWGQDRHYREPGSGERPWTDFETSPACTSGPKAAPSTHCLRRRRLLELIGAHLYDRLGEMSMNWREEGPNGYGRRLVNSDPDDGLRRMLFGMMTLASDEMAGQRMEVALLTNSQEEEQDCFSDDTHNSAFYDEVGIRNIYYGFYQNPDYERGARYQAPVSLSDIAQRVDAPLARKIDQALTRTDKALGAIQREGDAGQTFDLLIQPDNDHGRALIDNAVQALQAESRLMERLGKELNLESLNPRAATVMPTSGKPTSREHPPGITTQATKNP